MSERLNATIVHEPFWAMKVDEVFSALKSGHLGLTQTEVDSRIGVFGPNRISQKNKFGRLKILWHQLSNPLIVVLTAAGGLTWVLGEYIETAVILAAVLVNTMLGFWQENKAETVLDLLKTYVRTRTRVKRDGREMSIDAEHLVPGDVIKILQGDRVPADARLIFTNNFEADESVLTGESLPVLKSTENQAAATNLGNRFCMIFSGTLVTEGTAEAVVTATGDSSEFGKIARLIAAQESETTPLQKSLSRFTNQIGFVLSLMTVALFTLGIYSGHDVFDMLLIAVAVAVSAVPEGLPIAMTVILAVGIQRLAGRRGVIRRLLAAETLGSTSLILTDKTGTLTEASMEITRMLPYGGGGQDKINSLARNILLNTDVIIENPDDLPHLWSMYGRSLDMSLVRGIGKAGIKLSEAMGAGSVLGRLPFSSNHKFAGVAIKNGANSRMVLLGAPDVLLNFTDLPKAEKDRIIAEIDGYAGQGEKIIGSASRDMHDDGYSRIFKDKDFKGFTFDGMVTLRDPVRPNVKEAMDKMAGAGVRVAMVTGDYAGTAEAIGRELGMIDGKGALLTGDDMNYLQPDELAERAKDVTIYARLTPAQKLALVKLYQSAGDVVAVTGDGVNDAPALQAADIGIALGSGSDVAKSAADMVILDDDFITIVAAVEEGRRILDNIRKVIVYLLSNSFNELLLIGGSIILGFPIPLNALQILYVNFFSDSFPAIALAFEKGIDGLGNKPRTLKNNLIDGKIKFLLLVVGTIISVILFGMYWVLLRAGVPAEVSRTFIFASFGTYSIILAFSIRSLDKSILSYNPFSNLYLLAGVACGLLMIMSAIYVPFLQGIFGTVALPARFLSAVGAIGLLNIILFEVGKAVYRRKDTLP